MNHSFPLMTLGLLALAGLTVLAAPAQTAPPPKLRVLILSGSNNHDWQTTTPAIRATLEATGKFAVDVENNVASLKADSFAPYAVIVSDFNTFGKPPTPVWDAATRQGFLDHLAKGHGLVVAHAGGSVFYDWPEFQALACGWWGPATGHGPIQLQRVVFTEPPHPITAGLQPFWIHDEFWEKTEVPAGAKTLATVTLGADRPAERLLITHEVGRARGVALLLGHDAAAMKNTAWRTLLQRATEWAATGKVTLPAASEWPATRDDAQRMSAR